MDLKVLNVDKGIYSIYQGRYTQNSYIIYSSFYGVVAKSTKIEELTENEITIYFDICEWYGYWSLRNIIKRGIRKQENQFINTKVNFIFNVVKGCQMSLHDKYNIEIKLTKRYRRKS